MKSLVFLLLLGVALGEYPNWLPNSSYPAESRVVLDLKLYKAQFWAEAGFRPDTVVDNSWENPWVLENPNYGQGKGPATLPPKPTLPPVEGEWAQYDPEVTYKSGDEVQNKGQVYRCKPNVAAWCNGTPSAYEPGVGRAWKSAWLMCPGGDCTKTVVPTGAYNITKSEIAAKIAEITSGDMLRKVLNSMEVLPQSIVDTITMGNPLNPENVKRVETIITPAVFQYIFPWRNHVYSNEGFLKAIGKFPAFCRTYHDGRNSEAICRKSLAVMIAHFGQETGGHEVNPEFAEWRQALVHVREMGWNETSLHGYNKECVEPIWQTRKWPCGIIQDGPNKGEIKSYFGRGAKQLSYNYNYGPFSEFMYGDVNVLLKNPELVAETWLNFASATFFYLFPQPPKPSMYFVMDGTWQPNAQDIANNLTPGFGVTIQIINGGNECGGSVEVQMSKNRIQYYRAAAAYLGVPIPEDERMGCIGMKQFDAGGAGAVLIYYVVDETWTPQNPDGKAYACKLVGYQTPYSVLSKGAYEECVMKSFPEVRIIDDPVSE
eukprot:Filipodium_phascolosomae@DN2688_c0_g1_i1.p1